MNLPIDENGQIVLNDDTRADEKVISIISAELRRARKQANERDLMRALHTLRPNDGGEAA